MADGLTIRVDATRAYAKIDSITPRIRDQLRKVIPDLTRQLGAAVNSKLASELKSRKTLNVAQELHETTRQIYGLVRLEAADPSPALLPTYLEEGTRPHEIAGNPILAFYWDKMGADVFFRRVQHPGTKAYQFMARTFAEQREDIVNEIEDAVATGAREAR